MKRKYPVHICHECGTKFCKNAVSLGTKFSVGHCGCCKAENVPVTEPHNYGDFSCWPLPRDVDPSPPPKTFDDLVEPLLNGFNFKKVHQCMNTMGWKWYMAEGYDVPTVEQMHTAVRRLLESVVKSNSPKSVSSGGFLVEKIDNEDDPTDNGLVLQFVLSSYEVFFGDYE